MGKRIKREREREREIVKYGDSNISNVFYLSDKSHLRMETVFYHYTSSYQVSSKSADNFWDNWWKDLQTDIHTQTDRHIHAD